jgi:cobalt/nickel transport protein
MMKNKTTTVVVLIVLSISIVFFPLFWLQGAEFEGSDGQGGAMVAEVAGEEFEPWFEPVLARLIGGSLPGEMETLFFCIQTGIGVGVIAYCFGYLAARKKYCKEDEDEADEGEAPVSNNTTAQGA